jgi:hypothetical protein
MRKQDFICVITMFGSSAVSAPAGLDSLGGTPSTFAILVSHRSPSSFKSRSTNVWKCKNVRFSAYCRLSLTFSNTTSHTIHKASTPTSVILNKISSQLTQDKVSCLLGTPPKPHNLGRPEVGLKLCVSADKEGIKIKNSTILQYMLLV